MRDDVADENGESFASGGIEDQLQVTGVRGVRSHVAGSRPFGSVVLVLIGNVVFALDNQK